MPPPAFSATSTAATQNIQAAGYPPDMTIGSTASFWGRYNTQFWEVTFCQWQKRLDPTYDTYGSGTGTYNYVNRLSVSDVGDQLSAFATTGDIQRPLVTVAGTMDALLPIDHHARAYARNVAAARTFAAREMGVTSIHPRIACTKSRTETTSRPIKTRPAFPQLELIEPHAQRAFDLLVGQVERGAVLPPDQCIPRGGQIADTPMQPGHCANLFAP